MGLLDFVKKALEDNAKHIQEYKMRYDRMDDEQLLNFYRNRQLSTQQRMAIIQLLHERGYSTQENE